MILGDICNGVDVFHAFGFILASGVRRGSVNLKNSNVKKVFLK